MAFNYTLVPCFFFFFFMTFTYSEGHVVPAIFAFGDSLLDVGNNNYLKFSLAKASFGHNGVDFLGKQATGRFSNGRNAADFFAKQLSLSTPPPFLSIKSTTNKTNVLVEGGGVSFASGGAGIFNDTNTFFRQSIPLHEQVEHYSLIHKEVVQQLGIVEAETFIAKSVFLISIGSNDILGFFRPGSKLSQRVNAEDYINSLILLLRSHLKTIYGLGARKFAIIGVGLIGCSPSRRSLHKTGECNEEANYWSAKYNEGVKSVLQELKVEHTDITYSLLLTYNIMVDFIQNPHLHGFSEVKSACCGLGNLNGQVPCLPIARQCENRKSHLFWDPYHPTEAAAQKVINTYFNGPEEYSHPITAKKLIES